MPLAVGPSKRGLLLSGRWNALCSRTVLIVITAPTLFAYLKKPLMPRIGFVGHYVVTSANQEWRQNYYYLNCLNGRGLLLMSQRVLAGA